MSRSIRLLRRAQNDLIEIRNYVRRDRPIAADRLVEKVLERIESLERLPDRGVVPRDDRLRRLGYRVLIVSDDLIFYKILPEQVRVYRILHGRRKYSHLI